MKLRRKLGGLLCGLAVIGIAVQFVPMPRKNPPVLGTPAWASPRTEALARAACFDCHSNETRWPWYSRIAPLSWWIVDHVDAGRAKLNFSVPPYAEANEASETVIEREMPPASYAAMHQGARLSDAERAELTAGLLGTFGGEHAEASRRRGRER